MLPGSLAYTTFRWDPATGTVEDITAEEDLQTESAEPVPTPEATATRTPEPTRKAAPTPTATASVIPTPTAPAEPPSGAEEIDQVSAQSIGTHPATRILLILLLVGLGAVYYSKLRAGGRVPK
ncbi:hypothetical protein [Arthrobacter pityocampae]|uniref:hypothetical protein n=1 Tax=Arthrobacter pityocampae TaxID=547334 RepID=UPI00142DF138|nr:hypothetical protein [Arthrobacter pityocampae]